MFSTSSWLSCVIYALNLSTFNISLLHVCWCRTYCNFTFIDVLVMKGLSNPLWTIASIQNSITFTKCLSHHKTWVRLLAEQHLYLQVDSTIFHFNLSPGFAWRPPSHTQRRVQPDQCYFTVQITGSNLECSL